jgi:DNA-binding NtrC family response regulator
MVLKKARAMGIRCPVIIVSVKAQIQVRKLIEDLDVFEYIQKPLHASDLASAIRRAMNRG